MDNGSNLNQSENVNVFSEQEIDLRDYVRIFLKFKWVILICFIAVLAGTYFHTQRATKIYQSSCRVLLDTKRQSDMFFVNPAATNTKINNTIEILKSKPVLEKAYELLSELPQFDDLPVSRRNWNYLRSIQTETKRDTDILVLRFTSTDPQEAAIVPNIVALALIDQLTQYERAELENIKDFLEAQVEIVSNRLRAAEEDLRMYKIEQGFMILSDETRSLINRTSKIETDYEQALTEKSILIQSIDYLKEELLKQDSLVIDVDSVISSSFTDRLRAEVVTIQTRITNLITRNEYPDDHPEIVQLNRQLESAKQNLNEEIKRLLTVRSGSHDPIMYRGSLTERIASALIELNILETRIKVLNESIADYNTQLSLLPDKEVELARLERNYNINEKIHTMLVEKYEDAKIAVQARIANIRLLEEATVPSTPIKPNKRMNYLVGLVVGLGLGIVSSLILNSLDMSIHTIDDMERFVNLPIFGTIPVIKTSESDQAELLADMEKNNSFDELELIEAQSFIEARLITHYAPKSPVSESYRTLRTNLLARRTTVGPVCIALTSSAPKEGKTTTIANLGIIIAQTVAKVVLIDFDLRRPMLANLFNLEKENGASDYLVDPNMQVESIIKKTKVPNLDIITSGFIPPNPSEIIASVRTEMLIEQLKERYDYILFDAPPIIVVTDPLLLAKRVDMMLLVVKIDKTEKDIIKRAKELMATVGASFTGAVANGIVAQKYYSGYSFYYHYYDNYYAYEEDDKLQSPPNKSYIRKILRKS